MTSGAQRVPLGGFGAPQAQRFFQQRRQRSGVGGERQGAPRGVEGQVWGPKLWAKNGGVYQFKKENVTRISCR
jgi:hypothetical protein